MGCGNVSEALKGPLFRSALLDAKCVFMCVYVFVLLYYCVYVFVFGMYVFVFVRMATSHRR
jgi:hypothetical protein